MATPDTLTLKYFLDYEGAAGEHTLLFRFSPAVTDANAITRITAIVNTLKAFVTSATVFNRLRRADVGSNLSFPLAWTSIAGTSATAIAASQYPQFVSWVGRDLGGVRTRLTLHGASTTSDADYRILASENASVAAVLAALRTVSPAVVTVADAIPVWNDYCNTGYNAHFQRKRRKVA